MRPPGIDYSTEEERKQYISDIFRCKGNCEICGLCAAFRGKSAETVYEDYINGNKEFSEIKRG